MRVARPPIQPSFFGNILRVPSASRYNEKSSTPGHCTASSRSSFVSSKGPLQSKSQIRGTNDPSDIYISPDPSRPPLTCLFCNGLVIWTTHNTVWYYTIHI
ncbi:hypothetical protein BJX70DRAFT_378133 [Aspergillus crustosus]